MAKQPNHTLPFHPWWKLALTIVFALTTDIVANCQEPERTWSDDSGQYTITGSLVQFDESTITLRVKGRDDIHVEIDELCELDRRYVLGSRIVKQDAAQFELVTPHLERFRESPSAVMEILAAVHRNEPEAPYAAAMLGVAYAAEKADYAKAEKYLRLAARSIDARQEILGENYHKLTEMAVNNNLAVCALKTGKGDKAVKLFAENAELANSQIQFCTYHNATRTLETVSQSSLITLSNGSRRKLADMLATKPPANPGFEVPPNFLYLLEWNQPVSKSAFRQFIAGQQKLRAPGEKKTRISGKVFQTEDELLKRGYRPHLQGTGFLVTPELLVTNRNVVQSADNHLSYTITQFTEDGKPNLMGGSVVKWSPVQEEDLAIIRLDHKVDSEPLRIVETDDGSLVGADITVLGFPETFSTGEHLIASGGQIEDMDRENSWLYLTANLMKGNSGGPCVDMFGNVVGVSFERDRRDIVKFGDAASSRYDRSGTAVSAGPLIRFIQSVDSGYELLPPHTELYRSRQAIAERIRPSVYLVKSWKSPLSHSSASGRFREELRYSELQDLESATLKENRLYPDVWCPWCHGKTYFNCTNRLCRGGGIEKRKRVVAGVEPNSGRPIYRGVTYYDPCPTCGGSNKIECTHCTNGKLVTP